MRWYFIFILTIHFYPPSVPYVYNYIIIIYFIVEFLATVGIDISNCEEAGGDPPWVSSVNRVILLLDRL